MPSSCAPVPAASLRGRRDSIHAAGRRHWLGRIDRDHEHGLRANGGRRTSLLTSLPCEWLFFVPSFLAGKETRFFGGGEPALRSFRRRAHDFLPRKEKESLDGFVSLLQSRLRFMPALTAAAHALGWQTSLRNVEDGDTVSKSTLCSREVSCWMPPDLHARPSV